MRTDTFESIIAGPTTPLATSRRGKKLARGVKGRHGGAEAAGGAGSLGELRGEETRARGARASGTQGAAGRRTSGAGTKGARADKSRATRGGYAAVFALEILLKAVAVLIVVAIVSLMAYNEVVSRQAAQRADKIAEELGPTKIQQMQDMAQDYNRRLITQHAGLMPHPAENNGWREDADYAKQLSYPNEQVMGAIHIPKINVDLPIYHGTDDPTLAKGAGHLYGTSVPVGVKDLTTNGQNAALTSHRGLPTALLFTRLDELVVGDMFSLSVLGEEVKYRIDRVEVVDPKVPAEYQDLLRARMGEDRVTLITCTPFGVNTHRLIVSGLRTADPLVPARASLPFPLWMGQALIGVLAAIALVTMWQRRRGRRYIQGARHVRKIRKSL